MREPETEAATIREVGIRVLFVLYAVGQYLDWKSRVRKGFISAWHFLI
jgi:hypothetical protein